MTDGRGDQRVTPPVAFLALPSARPGHPASALSGQPRGPPAANEQQLRRHRRPGVSYLDTMPGRWMHPPARSTTSSPSNRRGLWKALSIHPNMSNHPDLIGPSSLLIAACGSHRWTANRDGRLDGGLLHHRGVRRLGACDGRSERSDVPLAGTDAAKGALLAVRGSACPSPGGALNAVRHDPRGSTTRTG
jgi:hypothetical protein